MVASQIADKKFILRKKMSLEQLLLQLEVEEFYNYEADLLDFRQYRQWLDSLTDDIAYFMPIVRNIKYGDWDSEYTRQGEDVAWFDEGKKTLAVRVQQIETGIHWAEEPSSRASHLITNVRVLDARPNLEEPEEVDTSMRFFFYRNRLDDETDFMIGKRLDTLRKVDGEWKICRRTILLDQTVLLEKNLTLFY